VLEELPMSNIAVFETIDQTLQMCTGIQKPFGGKMILGVGDFHQIAPVIPGAGPSETLAASIKSSPLWQKFSTLTLTTPMRFGHDRVLCDFVDAVGVGWNEPKVSLDLFDSTTSLETAADFLYPDDILQNPEQCLQRAFLSPRNIFVDDFNSLVLNRLPGEESMCSLTLHTFIS
jgi:hypothetical protein